MDLILWFISMIILILVFSKTFNAIKILNSNLNLQYDQNEKMIGLLTEIKEELKK